MIIDTSKQSLLVSAASIAFNPVFWNIAAQLEYRKHTLTKLAGGNARRGCYALAVTIFLLGIVRDGLYERALKDQPKLYMFSSSILKIVAAALIAGGNLLVLSSMWALGVTGTYLGDYFGILMDDMVTTFPFNVTAHPMYYGSFLSFLGTAIWYQRPAGIILSIEVLAMYFIATHFEEPFTSEIYAKRDRERKARGKKAR